ARSLCTVQLFFFSSRRRHTRSYGDWSSDVCSSDLQQYPMPSTLTAQVLERVCGGSKHTNVGAARLHTDTRQQLLMQSFKFRCLAGQDVERDEGVDHRGPPLSAIAYLSSTTQRRRRKLT